MERVLIQLPKPLKAKLDALRTQGYTASGYIRALLERELGTTKPTKKGCAND
jgi:mannitol/fructose-specific phosphotransferase system IIA component